MAQKRERTLPATRHQQLRTLLGAQPETVVTLRDLATELGVSEQTVRRDLAVLERSGIIDRTFGGAVIRSSQQRFEPVMETRETAEADKKLAIAQRALELLAPDDIAFFDASTTVLALIRLIPRDFDLGASTHSITALRTLSSLGVDHLALLGGEYRRVSDCMGGPQTLAQIAQMRFSVAFLSARAFDIHHGLTEARADEAILKSEAVRRAKRTVVLLDSTKFETISPYQYADLQGIDTLVVDSGAPPEALDMIRSEAPDLELIVANVP